MARIRSIKPEFFTSEQLAECSPSARLLFVGLWCFCDDGGVHPASTRRLKMEIFPADEITDKAVKTLVAELIRAGLLAEFEHKGETFWHVTGWDKHQRIDKPTLKYPRPLAEDSPRTRRPVDEASPPDWSGVERRGGDSDHSPIQNTHTASTTVSDVAAVAAVADPGLSPSAPRACGDSDPAPKPQGPLAATVAATVAAAVAAAVGRINAGAQDPQAYLEAYNAGAGQSLRWSTAYLIPCESLIARAADPPEVERVARFYRATLKDAQPSLKRFAADYDEWRSKADAKPLPEAPKPRREDDVRLGAPSTAARLRWCDACYTTHGPQCPKRQTASA